MNWDCMPVEYSAYHLLAAAPRAGSATCVRRVQETTEKGEAMGLRFRLCGYSGSQTSRCHGLPGQRPGPPWLGPGDADIELAGARPVGAQLGEGRVEPGAQAGGPRDPAG